MKYDDDMYLILLGTDVLLKYEVCTTTSQMNDSRPFSGDSVTMLTILGVWIYIYFGQYNYSV